MLYPLTTGADGGRNLKKLESNTTVDITTPSAQLGHPPDNCDPLFSIAESSGNSNLGNFGDNGDSIVGNSGNSNWGNFGDTGDAGFLQTRTGTLVVDGAVPSGSGFYNLDPPHPMRTLAGDGKFGATTTEYNLYLRRFQ